jgi:hypothetical protein
MRAAGSDYPCIPTELASGPRSALVHATPCLYVTGGSSSDSGMPSRLATDTGAGSGSGTVIGSGAVTGASSPRFPRKRRMMRRRRAPMAAMIPMMMN